MNPSIPPVPPNPVPTKPASKLPWILGCGCLTLLVVGLGIGGFAFYRYQAFKKNVEENLQKNIQVTRVNPTPAATIAPSSSDAAEIVPNKARAGWKTYVSTTDKLRPDLKPHFVAFSFSYPPTFIFKPQEDGTFAIVEKRGADGKDVAESVTVTWYEMTTADNRKEDYQTLKDLGKSWPKQYPQLACTEISTSSLMVNGVESFGMTWEFTTRDRKPTFVLGAKSILLHPPGKTRGVRIDLYGSIADPKLKRASDIGSHDDLAAILQTFKFLDVPADRPPATSRPPESANDHSAMIDAAVSWLRLLDAGDYQGNFAASAQQFQKGLTAEKWRDSHAYMQKQFGTLVSRSDDVNLKTNTSTAEDGKETVKYVLHIPAKFTKTAATEQLTLVKEAGEWKIADYSVTVKKAP